VFGSLSVKTYVEAKHLFARLLKYGIWIEDAKMVQKIVTINANVEEILVQNDSERIAIELTNLIKNHSEIIDNGLKADIKMKQNKMITV
jgi:Holliday junction resolvasome RuvABC endonuclease subunit